MFIQTLQRNRYARLASIILLAGSSIINCVLLGLIFFRLIVYRVEESCPQTSLAKIVKEESLHGASYPYETAHLSHVVIALHESGKELENLAKGLNFWKRYPPCLHNSYPTNWATAHANLVFMLDGEPAESFSKALLDLYYGLPRAVRSCFASMEIRHAGLNTDFPSYNSTETQFVQKIADAERNFFSAFLSNKIGLESPSYALLLTADAIPIQANWLNLLDYETRVPVERFWIKGSLYRGNFTATKFEHRDMIAFGRVALYNIGDPALSTFYETAVRPAAAAMPLHHQLKPFEKDWSNYLFQFQHYIWSRMVASMFRPTDAIQDHSGCSIDLKRLQNDSPDTLLVRVGTIPDLPDNNPENL